MRRRASGEVPSSIGLDHGDILVTDGPAQSEYEHRTGSGLQGPWADLTFSWMRQHVATTHCVLSTGMCNVLCSTFVRARF